MRKSLFLGAIILGFIFLLSGCGQSLQVTVWNDSGVVPSLNGQWLAGTLTPNTGTTTSQVFLETATSDSSLDGNSSFTVTLKENANITVTDNGYYYPNGVTTSGATSFMNTATQTIYGGFPNPPHWYASCFINAVVIYKQ